MSNINLKSLLTKSINNEVLSANECLYILNFPDNELKELLDLAYEVRKKYKGNKVSIQILSNLRSGNCSQDCHYCSQSCVSKANIDKYSLLDADALLSDGRVGKSKNVKRHCIGVSGITFEDNDFDKICERIKKLRDNIDTDICCSIGFLTEKQAIKLKEAGVKRINHNLNTGRNYYNKICTTHKYETRVNNIKMLQRVGFEICCGGIVGMGEKPEDIVDMLTELHYLRPQSVPINFLIPIKGTPFENMAKNLTPEFCLKVLCLARLMIPRADVRVAAGREIHIKDKQNLMFYPANSIFASGYLTEEGQGITDAIKLIEDSGFEYEIG